MEAIARFDAVESHALGASSHVRKPVEFERFSKAARQLGTHWLRLSVESALEGLSHASIVS